MISNGDTVPFQKLTHLFLISLQFSVYSAKKYMYLYLTSLVRKIRQLETELRCRLSINDIVYNKKKLAPLLPEYVTSQYRGVSKNATQIPTLREPLNNNYVLGVNLPTNICSNFFLSIRNRSWYNSDRSEHPNLVTKFFSSSFVSHPEALVVVSDTSESVSEFWALSVAYGIGKLFAIGVKIVALIFGMRSFSSDFAGLVACISPDRLLPAVSMQFLVPTKNFGQKEFLADKYHAVWHDL